MWGVVIKDFSGTNKWQELMKSIGVEPYQEKEFEDFFDTYEPEICIGKDIEDLIPLIKKHFEVTFSPHYSFLKDFVNRFEKNESLWPILEKVSRKYRTDLLTNMYTNMLPLINKSNLLPPINWDVIIDSSIEKVRKPQKEIFALAEKRAGVSASEILFVENSKKHVDAAKEYGWKTFLYDSSDIEKSNKKLLQSI